jgi:hypothetical protein
MGNECTGPRFFGLGTSWKRAVSFTPRQLYRKGKGHQYPLERRLGMPQSPSGRYGAVKMLDPTGTRTPTSPPSSP